MNKIAIPAGASSPTIFAVRQLGIPVEYAFLIADKTVAIGRRLGVWPYRSVWPEGHAWHVWAINTASALVGYPAVEAFGETMADYYKQKALG